MGRINKNPIKPINKKITPAKKPYCPSAIFGNA